MEENKDELIKTLFKEEVEKHLEEKKIEFLPEFLEVKGKMLGNLDEWRKKN